ncbi:DUF389 domain-containing protein [Pseudanabaenaceae cyanobacterium LEGE 13415]|nr:DUF389 domain-containing protein [Pseudanabaenaceae cyanobacterium LEGE 13415]
MSRTIEAIVPPDRTEALLGRLKQIDGVVGLSLSRNASIRPPGDIVTIQATNTVSPAIFNLLTEFDLARSGLIRTSQNSSLISSQNDVALHRESSETIWEEMLNLLREQSNVTVNFLVMLFCSGALAATGFWTNTLFLVLAGQVLGPHFEPLARIPFGVVVRRWQLSLNGIIAAIVGFFSVALGAAIAVGFLQVVQPRPGLDLNTQTVAQYFSSLSGSSILAASIAAIAGSVIIAAQQLVLLTGVYLGLNLVPSMSLVGMAIASGKWHLAQSSFINWLANAGLVLGWCAVVFSLKQVFWHRRQALN